MFRHRLSALATALLLLAVSLTGCAAADPKGASVVLAAASLQEALSAVADDWAAAGHVRPVIAFASTSALARQIDNGAPADIFISADPAWMDEVERQGFVRAGTRANLLANHLVLIAPRDSSVQVDLGDPASLMRGVGNARLAMADPDAVPAGKYGKSALQTLTLWQHIQSRVAPAENVRAALALVERGEAPLGIVYATDAKASKRVRVVARFPADSHRPIRYPVAVLRSSRHADAMAFRDFLASESARRSFARFGFEPLP